MTQATTTLTRTVWRGSGNAAHRSNTWSSDADWYPRAIRRMKSPASNRRSGQTFATIAGAANVVGSTNSQQLREYQFATHRLLERDAENSYLAADAAQAGPLDELLAHSITFRIRWARTRAPRCSDCRLFRRVSPGSRRNSIAMPGSSGTDSNSARATRWPSLSGDTSSKRWAERSRLRRTSTPESPGSGRRPGAGHALRS